jgi:hypothetical protein
MTLPAGRHAVHRSSFHRSSCLGTIIVSVAAIIATLQRPQ